MEKRCLNNQVKKCNIKKGKKKKIEKRLELEDDNCHFNFQKYIFRLPRVNIKK